MYKINDYVIYNKEVCVIKDIIKKKIKDKDYYVLFPISDASLKIETPTDNKGLRKVISKAETLKIIETIPSIETLENINDRMLENEYKKLLNDATHEALIKIIKTTYSRNQTRMKNKKKIGEIDDNYFKLAEKLLYNEFSISLSKPIDEVKEYVIQMVIENNKKTSKK